MGWLELVDVDGEEGRWMVWVVVWLGWGLDYVAMILSMFTDFFLVLFYLVHFCFRFLCFLCVFVFRDFLHDT